MRPLDRALEKVERSATDKGLVAVPTLDAFTGLYGPNLWVSGFDPHPNAAAHALLAERLEAAVRDLPPTCFERSRVAG